MAPLITSHMGKQSLKANTNKTAKAAQSFILQLKFNHEYIYIQYFLLQELKRRIYLPHQEQSIKHGIYFFYTNNAV